MLTNSAGQEVCQDSDGQSFCSHEITAVTQWYFTGGWPGLEDPRWLLSQVWCYGRGWLESYTQLGLLTRVPIHAPSLAWLSQGNGTSYMVTIFPKSEHSKRTRQKLMSFYDLVSEFMLHYCCHTLLVKSVMCLPRFKERWIDSTSWWGSSIVT